MVQVFVMFVVRVNEFHFGDSFASIDSSLTTTLKSKHDCTSGGRVVVCDCSVFLSPAFIFVFFHLLFGWGATTFLLFLPQPKLGFSVRVMIS